MIEDEDSGVSSLPLAEVHLPDGQRLRLPVTRRRRDRSGRWWYTLALEVPDREDVPRGGPRLVTRGLTISVPYPVVRPVAGVCYASLDPPPPEERRRWRLDDAPLGMGDTDYLVHRLDCAQTHSTRLLTDRQALEYLAEETTAGCPVCRPETVLRGLL